MPASADRELDPGATEERPSDRGVARAAAAPPIGWQRPPRDFPHLALRVLGRAATNFREDRGTSLAAAISYYALFSLFPLTLLAVSIFGLLLRSEELQQRVLEQILTQLPVNPEQEGGVADALQRAAEIGPTLAGVSFLGALWTASALSAAVRSALNVIFEATRRRPFLRGKAMDYLLIPIIGLPFLGGIVLTTAWRFLQRAVEQAPFVEGELGPIWILGALAIPFVLSFVAFLLLYRLIPNRDVEWRYAAVGALPAALLFEALKVGFAFYLANFATYDVIYGPIAGVIVMLFWVYLTANVTLFGAEVAVEAPHVVHEEPRHGRLHREAGEGDWRHAAWSFIRGLVLAGEEEATAPRLEEEGRAAATHLGLEDAEGARPEA
jgi:membrane protein